MYNFTRERAGSGNAAPACRETTSTALRSVSTISCLIFSIRVPIVIRSVAEVDESDSSSAGRREDADKRS